MYTAPVTEEALTAPLEIVKAPKTATIAAIVIIETVTLDSANLFLFWIEERLIMVRSARAENESSI